MNARNIRNIPHYAMAPGALDALPGLVADIRARRDGADAAVVYLIDEFFAAPAMSATLARVGIRPGDAIRFISTAEEPTTQGVDELVADLRSAGHERPAVVVGMGGGVTLDTAKAVSNLFTNEGRAADYQGWDLVKRPGIYKVGVPTISGTGAESSRTCVLTNHDTGLKLGMNSDHTLFDQLVLDPALPATVPRNQYFYTGMDTYIHCIESLEGRHRNPIGDALAEEALALCRKVFLDGDMQSPASRERLMTASYLGGCALATSFVGVVHPMSAGLSVVLGIHHCLANCLTMLVMDEFYPAACREFRSMAQVQGVEIPAGVCANATDGQLDAMAAAASLHERPLANALGPDFRAILPRDRMVALYRRM